MLSFFKQGWLSMIPVEQPYASNCIYCRIMTVTNEACIDSKDKLLYAKMLVYAYTLCTSIVKYLCLLLQSINTLQYRLMHIKPGDISVFASWTREKKE